MERSVQPEILDQLPACNIDAIASRRDLLKINGLMGNFRWLENTLRQEHPSADCRFLELGAGDGTLAKRLIPNLPRGSYSAIDLAPEPADWPSGAEWIRQDLCKFAGFDTYTHVIANLMLHHFEADTLRKIGQRITAGSVRTIIACEPCRRPIHRHQLRAGKWIGFNRVTLHDGSVSVEAGFRGDELPKLLTLNPHHWQWTIRESWMGAYRMWAQRR
jgi:hypothetical protein